MAKNALAVILAGEHLDFGCFPVQFPPFRGEHEHTAENFELAVDAGDHQPERPSLRNEAANLVHGDRIEAARGQWSKGYDVLNAIAVVFQCLWLFDESRFDKRQEILLRKFLNGRRRFLIADSDITFWRAKPCGWSGFR